MDYFIIAACKSTYYVSAVGVNKTLTFLRRGVVLLSNILPDDKNGEKVTLNLRLEWMETCFCQGIKKKVKDTCDFLS